MTTIQAFLCLGANLGDPRTQIEDALRWMDQHDVQVVRRSSSYITQPVGLEDQPWYVNCVVQAETTLDPMSLLDRCQEAEARAGRVPTVRFGPRPLDVDILLYNDLCLVSDRLVIPHPRMHERRFVLVPLLEIAPDVRDPQWKQSYADILGRLDEGKKVFKSLTRES